MSSFPHVSVALCTYNGARFLEEQLDSLLAQDYPEIEIVAVDDGSSDGTFDILKRYRRRDVRIRVYQNPSNLGFTKNFERAIQLSSGSLIAPCDQDDIWNPEKLSRLVAARDDAALVYCDSLLVDEHGNAMGMKATDKLNMYRGNDPRPFLFHNCISGHALLCTRELVNRAMPFPAGSYHDWWLAMIAAATGRIEYVDTCLVQFRQHTASVTDLSGLKEERPGPASGFGNERFKQRIEWIKRLREIPDNSQRDFFNKAYALFERWQKSYFSPELMRFIHQNRRALFSIPKSYRIHRTLDFCFGLKLRRLIKPYKYALPAARNAPV